MKKILIFLLFTFIAVSSYSQNQVQSDQVNIKEYVRNNIIAAKDKEKNKIQKNESKTAKITQNNTVFNYSNDIKYIVLGAAAFVSFGFVGVRRIKLRSDKKLKHNINLIRKEYAVKTDNPKLSNIRKKLCGHDFYDSDNKDLVVRAKEYKIAQGELYLAARIRSHKLIKISEKA